MTTFALAYIAGAVTIIMFAVLGDRR